MIPMKKKVLAITTQKMRGKNTAHVVESNTPHSRQTLNICPRNCLQHSKTVSRLDVGKMLAMAVRCRAEFRFVQFTVIPAADSSTARCWSHCGQLKLMSMRRHSITKRREP